MRSFFWLVAGLYVAALAPPACAQQSTFTYDAVGNLVGVAGAVSPGTAIITGQPRTQLVQSNSAVSLSVSATGLGNSYQWLSNGVAIFGATNDTLLLPGSAGTNGIFSVTICNSFGCVTSTPAALWADSNNNGIPDWWEMEYFGNLNQTAQGDYDGDGVDNLDEYLEGTDPTNPNSYDPRLYINVTGGTVTAAPAQPYYTMGQIVTLAVATNSGQPFLGWTGDAVGAKPGISLAMTSHKTVNANCGPPLNVALENTNLFCTSGGDAPWFGETETSEDGLVAAQSGLVGVNTATGLSWLQAITPYAGQSTQISFWWMVSAMSPNGLSFSVDGSSLAAISGTVGGWQLFQTTVTPGSHVLVWTFSGGAIGAPTGLPYFNCGWVDGVTLTPVP